MVGMAWIIDLHNISEHFAFWARSLSGLENVFLIFLALQCKIQGIFLAKKVVGHNFWTEGPTDLRWTSLSYIFDALFGDTPLGHIFFRICPYGHIWAYLGIFGHIWAYGHMGICEKIWPSGVSPKRASKITRCHYIYSGSFWQLPLIGGSDLCHFDSP